MRGYEKNGQIVLSRNGKIHHPGNGDMVNLPQGDCPRDFFGVTLVDVVQENTAPPGDNMMPAGVEYVFREGAIAEVMKWTAKTLPTADDVRAEAHRRICLYCPEWKQRNLTARAAEFALKVSHGEALTDEEQAEWVAGQAMWDHIKAIRVASNALEVSPGYDYQDDKHWPGVKA